MNVVGKVGSLISQGVYSVATPFHPFGGAIDVIVVQQQDGSFRSTPWYVRFGKFQGVLKGAEKFVKISVNGVEANFHMYLDNSGEAYFIREVEAGKDNGNSYISGSESSPSTTNGLDKKAEAFRLEHSVSDCGVGKLRDSFDSLNRLERTESDGIRLYYDFQDKPSQLQPSPLTEYESASYEVENQGDPQDSDSEVVLVSVDGHILTAPLSAAAAEQAAENIRLDTPQFHLAPGDGTEFCEGSTEFASSETSWTTDFVGKMESSDDKANGVNGRLHCDIDNEEPFPLYEAQPSRDDDNGVSVESVEDSESDLSDITSDTVQINGGPIDSDTDSRTSEHQGSGRLSAESDEKPVAEEISRSILVGHEDDNTVEPQPATFSEEIIRQPFANLRFELSLCKDELHQGMGVTAAAQVFDAHRISPEEYKKSAVSILESENLVVRIEEKYLPWKKAAPIVLGKAAFDLEIEIEADDVISVAENELTKSKDDERVIESGSGSGRRWRLWPIPFRRVKTVEHRSSNSSSEDMFVDSEPGIQQEAATSVDHESPRKQLVRTNVPTSEQVASLNLKDGQNMITFSFSTRVLGKQQVDAHIYLWKWDAKIVISDVDGTITKSDVLGQFMPLVGKDWAQIGVARLFSAIKENGYQLLFLSARAIVQAYLTRSFLLNLKQDGKALPNGPVVISPDGLFPALYREVIRRAPHEFKIACLEDIRKLFPPDYNPFYAGFGNRDTDELSYRKLGIPKGKIFIINPKGEVATGHRIDVKSYTSLHTLVNDMFPPTSLVEQEDYNAWNFWKTPIEEVMD